MNEKDKIREIVLDDPDHKNALSYALLDDLSNSLSTAKDDGALAVIITGANDVFSAGANFEDLTGTIDDIAIDDAIEKIVIQIREMPAPVFAAVEGPCMGGAVDIALACDFLVASEEAFFEIPAARLGLLYNPDAVNRWHARLSGTTLRRILLLGERFTAAEARHAGIVSHIVENGSALPHAQEFAAKIIKENQGVVAATKSLIVALENGGSDLSRWESVRRKILDSPERRESIAKARRQKN